jgi:hypothetical protein
MLEPIEARTGVRPSELLVDGGYPGHDAIDQATAAGVTLYAPVPKPRSKASEPPDPPPIDPHLPKPGDSDAVAAWRIRMGTDDAKHIYKQHAATPKTVNADARPIAAGSHRVARHRQGHRQCLSLRPHLQHPALHHRERVATLTLTVDRSSSGWRARSRSAPAYPHVISAVASDEALPGALAADLRPPPPRRRCHRRLAAPSGAANRAHALSRRSEGSTRR